MSEPVRWQLEQGVAEILFEHPERSLNVLDEATIDALQRVVDEVVSANGVRAIVLASAHQDVFLAGADIQAIRQLEEPALAMAMVSRVQSLFEVLNRQRVPVVAAIDGACLGAGLELALACHRRIVSDNPKTRLGLPEVLLGLIPGFGGTQRLPRLIGVAAAVRLILSGARLDHRRAVRQGLADLCVPREAFRQHVRRYALELVDGRGRYRRILPSRLSIGQRLLLAVGPLRDVYFWLAERRVQKQTLGYYPAALKALKAMREGMGKPLSEGLAIEAGLVGGLVVSPECKSLVRLHLLRERAEKQSLVESDSVPMGRVRSAAVLGAGVMGAGIALALARRGIHVRLRDLTTEVLRCAQERNALHLEVDVGRGRISRREAQRILARISLTTEPVGFGRVDMVIEAVAEDLEIKREILAEIEPCCRDACVFATNTSSLSVTELAQGVRRPARVVGLHFFNPVHKLSLVEVARGRDTSDRTLATAVELARVVGKTPIVVTDTPGFLVNRLLMRYLMEAVLMVEEGVPVLVVDQAMRRFGMPLGPLELLDQVGLDVAHDVSATLSRAFVDQAVSSRLLGVMVKQGRLGRKSGRGFYRHGKRARPDDVRRLVREAGGSGRRKSLKRGVLQERMVLPMLSEAARCLEEGVVSRAGDVDMASVLGFGFPAFRGGLLRFADSLGVAEVAQRLEALAEVEGPRFTPATLLLQLAREGTSFADLDDL